MPWVTAGPTVGPGSRVTVRPVATDRHASSRRARARSYNCRNTLHPRSFPCVVITQLAARLGAYLLGGYERHVFAGISRRYQGGAGLTAKLLVRPRDLLDAEAGVGVVQQRSTARVDQSFGVGRAALSYKHSFTETALLQQVLELLSNLKDSKDQLLNSETSLTAPLSKRIALKAAYLIRYDNLPEPGFKKSDRVFTTGIQILF